MMSNRLQSQIVAVIGSGENCGNSSLKLDIHADSPVIGSDTLIFRTHYRKVKVNGFTSELRSKTVDVVDAALTYKM